MVGCPKFSSASGTGALPLILLAYARPGFAFSSLSFWKCTQVAQTIDSLRAFASHSSEYFNIFLCQVIPNYGAFP